MHMKPRLRYPHWFRRGTRTLRVSMKNSKPARPEPTLSARCAWC